MAKDIAFELMVSLIRSNILCRLALANATME